VGEWEAAARESGSACPARRALEPRPRPDVGALRVERVCEVAYDHLQAIVSATDTFLRWRPDKAPADCRYDQLESSTPFELKAIFGL